MEETPHGNQEIDRRSVFEVLNQYHLLFFAFSCILASVFLQQILIAMDQFRLGITIAPIVGMVLPVVILLRKFYPGVREQLRLRSVGLLTSALVSAATLVMVVVVDHVYVISQQFMPSPESYLEGLKALKPDGVGSTVITFVGLCIAVPFAEEIVFRGIVQRVFSRNMSAMMSIALAGVFFGVIHLSPQLLLSMTCFGIFLGFVFYATSNLTYTFLSHAVLNGVAFAQLTFESNDTFAAPFYVQEWWYLPLAVLIVIILSREIKRGATPTADTPLKTHDDSV